jgi:hypothetical protein
VQTEARPLRERIHGEVAEGDETRPLRPGHPDVRAHALPFGMGLHVAGTELGNAALGVRESWNHDVSLRQLLVSGRVALVERGAILRFWSGQRIVEIAEGITEIVA